MTVTYQLYGPFIRYVKLRVAHAPGMPGTFSPSPTSKETASLRFRHASRHVRHACAVMHAGIANPQWRGKRSRRSRHMRNPQFYVSGKRPMNEWQHYMTSERVIYRWNEWIHLTCHYHSHGILYINPYPDGVAIECLWSVDGVHYFHRPECTLRCHSNLMEWYWSGIGVV